MITGDHNLIKNINRKLILEEIIKHREISRADIAKSTGLNKVTVSAQVTDLLEDNLLNERKGEKARGNGGGKKPILLSLKADVGFSVGIDMMAQGLKVIVTDLNGEEVLKDFKTLEDISEKNITESIIYLIQDLTKRLPKSEYGIIGITLAVHGHTRNDGFIIHCDNLKLENIDLKKPLEKKLKTPVNITSVNKLGIIAEKAVYNMKEKCVIYLNMSAGLGGSIVVDNQILDGRDGLGGELGHMIINTDGRQCHCGNRGCWETYACESAFLRDLAVVKHLPQFSLNDFKKAILENDPVVIAAIDDLYKYINVGITNILNIFNPDAIILHNRLVYEYPKLLEKLKIHLKFRGNTEIEISTYKDDGGCIGGCYLNIMNFLKIEQITKI